MIPQPSVIIPIPEEYLYDREQDEQPDDWVGPDNWTMLCLEAEEVVRMSERLPANRRPDEVKFLMRRLILAALDVLTDDSENNNLIN